MLLFIGAPELFTVFLVVVLFFGADKIPEIAKGLARGMRQVKDATNEIKREINESAVKDVKDAVETSSEKIAKDTEELQEDLNNLGAVKRTRSFEKNESK